MAVSSAILFVSCFAYALAADGGWSPWSLWSLCSVTCGQGTKYRFRNCNNPLPTRGGKFCIGNTLQTEECINIANCPVNGNWSEWSNWSPCSVSCDTGFEKRYRSCNNPRPQFEGMECPGLPQENRACSLQARCPRNGKWSSWSVWTACSVTCGSGTRQRFRACNNPPPSDGGRECKGTLNDKESCSAHKKCPIHGRWSAWSGWTLCPVTCGSSEVQRHRVCDSPPPQHGGLPCPGNAVDRKACAAEILCPVNGQWSEWSQWEDCFFPNCHVNFGYSFSQRSCNNPLPAHNGLMCQGEFLKGGRCVDPVNCPTDGGWSEWTAWNCTENTAERTRECDNPPPTNGGKPCAPGGAVELYASDGDDEDEEFELICGKRNNAVDDGENEDDFDDFEEKEDVREDYDFEI